MAQTNGSSITVYSPNAVVESVAATGATFTDVRELVEKTLSSDGSKRVYRQTYRAWTRWCEDNGVDALNLTPANVWQFLASGNTTKATRNRQLSAMRKLAQMLYVLDGDAARRLYEALTMIKAPTPDESAQLNERSKHALTPSEVHRILTAWDGDGLTDVRNRAIISTLALTGIRRAELASLRWSDVNLDAGTIHIRHGKGDKSRDVSIVGQQAIDDLRAWKSLQSEHGGEREYVFCSVVAKGHRLGADKPVSTRAVNNVVDETENRADVKLTPHTLRRTFITEALSTGASVQSVQAQAGHSRGDTTLQYAKAVDAVKRHSEFRRFRYG